MKRADRRGAEMAALRDRLSSLGAASLPINEKLDFADLLREGVRRPLPDGGPLRGDDCVGRRGRGANAVAGLSIDYAPRMVAVARCCTSWRSTLPRC